MNNKKKNKRILLISLLSLSEHLDFISLKIGAYIDSSCFYDVHSTIFDETKKFLLNFEALLRLYRDKLQICINKLKYGKESEKLNKKEII